MNALIDIIFIYICTNIYISINILNTQSIIAMLATLIGSCLAYYFNNKYVSLFIVGLFVLCSILCPIYIFYFPLFLYLFKFLHPDYLLCPYFVEGIFAFLFVIIYLKYGITFHFLTLHAYLFLICFCIFSYILVGKTNRIVSLEKNIHKISDDHSYMQQTLQRKQKRQHIEQDREIHLATLAERNRIAREIHDNVGHMLSRSILQLGAILTINTNETLKKPLSNLKDTLDIAMNSIRESVHDLRDESLDLHSMIQNMIKEFPNLYVKLDYDMSNYASKDIKYCFLAILKEAMTNTIKHSNGSTMEITIREHPALYQLLIRDNGTTGNKPAKDTSNSLGMGLDNMRERVTALGGTINISCDNGFRIFIAIQKNVPTVTTK